jgi:ribulose-phosphate 3-epimerase
MTFPCIAASLLAADSTRLGDQIASLDRDSIDIFHWDIMDGHFVPNLTFGPHIVAACRPLTSKEFDVHLMVTDPSNWIDVFVQAGADTLTIHTELGDDTVSNCLTKIKAQKCKAGIAFNPETSLDHIDIALLQNIDRILLMSVKPGFSFQSFIDITDKIKQAAEWRKHYPHLDIMIDGGINISNAATVVACGATSLVTGNALFKAKENYTDTLKKLRGMHT